MAAAGGQANLQQQLQLALQMNAELHAIAYIDGWSGSTEALRDIFMLKWNIPTVNAFNHLFNQNVPPQFRPSWVASTSYPHLQREPGINTDRAKRERVRSDIATIQQRFDTNVEQPTLALLAKFPETDRRYREGFELLIPLPPNKGQTFCILVSEVLKQLDEVKCSHPVAIFFAVAFPHLKASKALHRKLPIYHFSESCHYRLNRTGGLVPIRIDKEVIDQDPTKHITWANANFDQNSLQTNGIGALWQNADLSRPPQGNELQSSAYQHTLVNKTRCPGPTALRDQIGQQLYDYWDKLATDEGGFAFGIAQVLKEHEGEICVIPGHWLNDTSLAIHAHFFDKQAVIAGDDPRLWDRIKGRCATVMQRAQDLLQEATNVRQYIRSPGYAAANKTGHSGMHAYATSSWLHGAGFWFLHDDRIHIHLKRPEREHCDSAVAQTLNSRNVERAQATGLDWNNLPDHRHLISFDYPIPSTSSSHISWGPASNPILGCIATVSKSSFRPTTSAIQFRFANLPNQEEKASRPAKKSRMVNPLNQLKKSVGRKK